MSDITIISSGKKRAVHFVYPAFPAVILTSFFRIGGSGLANCLFVYAKAIVEANRRNLKIIAPTWFNISIGTYIRHERDKRHYLNLFNHKNELSGLYQLYLRLFKRNQILKVEGIDGFFAPLLDNNKIVFDYIYEHIKPERLTSVNAFDFVNCVAVHIRLGDYNESRRIPFEWYKSKIEQYGHGKKVILFSDGTDEELKPILSIDNVKRMHFGSAIADIIAISRCEFLIGSDSSFSAWGAFLGQVPCCFYRLEFGTVLLDNRKQIIEHPNYFQDL